eukprot:scaffold43660_cov64-Phaeocystis_antarctica.AAC.1
MVDEPGAWWDGTHAARARGVRCFPPVQYIKNGTLRFAAAVLAAAAITPTPAAKGLARLSEALASPALVNKDVLWTRCGALDKMAPHSAVLLHSHSVKCQESRTGVTVSDRRSRLDRAESVVTAGTAEAAVEHHRFMQIFDVHLQCSSVPEHATFFDPSR